MKSIRPSAMGRRSGRTHAARKCSDFDRWRLDTFRNCHVLARLSTQIATLAGALAGEIACLYDYRQVRP
jgi:hypothetical protein